MGSLQFSSSQFLCLARRSRNLPRKLHTSASRRKALQNWKRPSIEELGVPKEPWNRVHDANQKKFTKQLLAGLVVFPTTVIIVNNQVFFNGTPTFVRETGFSSKFEAAAVVEEEEEAIAAEEDAEAEAAAAAEAEAAAARIAAEEAAAAEAARIAAEEVAAAEAARIAAEEAAAAEAARIAAEAAAAEAARIAAEEAAAAAEDAKV